MTALSGAGNTETVHDVAPEVEEVDFHDVNARLRYAWLEAVRDRNTALDSGDTAAAEAATARMDSICTEFLTTNRRLAMSGAKKFLRNSPYDTDYEQVAMLSILEAFTGTNPELMYQVSERADGTLVAKTGWDPAQSTFGGFSRNFIRGGVGRAVANYETGLSYNMWDKRPKVLAAQSEFEAEHGYAPSVPELSRITGLPEVSVRAILTPKAVSADTPIGEGTMTLLDTLAERAAEESGDNRDLLSQVVADTAKGKSIRPMDLFSLLMRKGLLGLDPLPVVDVASRLGIGRGTVTAGSDRAWGAVTRHVEDTYRR